MKKLYPFAIALFIFTMASFAFAREAKLVRYPSYHNGRIAFTYLGDIWTADENGQNVQRLTVNKARDAYPKFSPAGRPMGTAFYSAVSAAKILWHSST